MEDRREKNGFAVVTGRGKNIKPLFDAAGIPTRMVVVQDGPTWPDFRPPAIVDTVGMPIELLAGIIKIPIPPATTFVSTWNPGLEGDSDRPAEAPRSRMISMELPPPTPTEQAARVKSFFSKAPKEIQPHSAEINAAITFFNQVRSGIHKGSIQQRGRGSKAVPGPRDLNFFVLAGKTDGWMAALEQMRVFCDQNVEDRDKDWKFIQEQFAINFGHDGRAHSRPAPARA